MAISASYRRDCDAARPCLACAAALENELGGLFWHIVARNLKNRGVQDIFIACVEGLKDFPEAIEAVYPKTAVQLCIVRPASSKYEFRRRFEVESTEVVNGA